MGFSISWIAFQGITKEEVLARSGLRDTGEVLDEDIVDFSLAVLPTGWILLFTEDVTYALPERLEPFSKGCRLLACCAEEHVMVSAAFCYEDGQEIWSVLHDAQQGKYHLDADGTLPPEFEEARQRLTKEQDEDKDGGVDYIFNVPVDTLLALCGYSYDRVSFDWGEPVFTRLEPA